MRSRSLTEDEMTLAKSVFGDAIDYDRVRIHDGKFLPFQPKGVAMAPEGHLYMYGCYSDNYAQASPIMRGIFIHEMTHVWQFQQRILNPVVEAIEINLQHLFNYRAAYAYTLDGKRDLLSYNMEQQASLIQDYYMLTRENDTPYRAHCKNRCGQDEKKALFESALKNFHQNPSYGKQPKFPSKRKNPKP